MLFYDAYMSHYRENVGSLGHIYSVKGETTLVSSGAISPYLILAPLELPQAAESEWRANC